MRHTSSNSPSVEPPSRLSCSNTGCLSENTNTAVSAGLNPCTARLAEMRPRNSRTAVQGAPSMSASPVWAAWRTSPRNSRDCSRISASDMSPRLGPMVASCSSTQRSRMGPSCLVRSSGRRVVEAGVTTTPGRRDDGKPMVWKTLRPADGHRQGPCTVTHPWSRWQLRRVPLSGQWPDTLRQYRFRPSVPVRSVTKWHWVQPPARFRPGHVEATPHRSPAPRRLPGDQHRRGRPQTHSRRPPPSGLPAARGHVADRRIPVVPGARPGPPGTGQIVERSERGEVGIPRHHRRGQRRRIAGHVLVAAPAGARSLPGHGPRPGLPGGDGLRHRRDDARGAAGRSGAVASARTSPGSAR